MKRIPIRHWAEGKGIDPVNALNLARRGHLKTAKLEPIAYHWTVDASERVPITRRYVRKVIPANA